MNENVVESALSAEVEEELVEEFGRVEASRRVSRLLSPAAIDALLARAEAEGAGTEEVLAEITRAVLERALEVGMADHLAYEKGDPAGLPRSRPRSGAVGAGSVQARAKRDRAAAEGP